MIKGNVDYDTIFELYGIMRSSYSDSEMRALRLTITRRFKKYLEKRNCQHLKWEDLSQQDKDYFICFEIDDYMIERAKSKLSPDRIKKNIKEYMFNNIAQGEKYIEGKNNKIDVLHKKDYFDENSSDKKKKEAYKQFCDDWRKLTFQPVPSYKTFLKNPDLSIYDYLMSMKFGDLGYDVETYRQEMNETILNIVVDVLSKSLGLKIDYDSIQESIESTLSHSDDDILELMQTFEFEPFTFSKDEYINNVIKGREGEYSEEDIEDLKQQYEGVKKRLMEYFYHMNRLRDLKNFYTVNEKIIKK